ncbi:MAG: class I SAM-dependent methyltransferase [Chloroflexi bacterium]|nr:class I SAM-dependent methyltransferase [Chloroflexota bacterium]
MIYDDFSTDYDRFVNWHGRLATEMPFLQKQLREVGAQRILDTACGTGNHAIALAKLGYDVAGADLSTGMIECARFNAAASGMDIQFEAVGFGKLKHTFGAKSFDAVICLGNSLPHVLTTEALSAALQDITDCLKPGGTLIIQNRNFDSVMQSRQRWMEPQSARDGETEWLFLRLYDFDADGLITFHMVTLRREGEGAWIQTDMATRLRPLLHEEMITMLQYAGFSSITCYGDMTGTPFNANTSGNLVIIARLSEKY